METINSLEQLNFLLTHLCKKNSHVASGEYKPKQFRLDVHYHKTGQCVQYVVRVGERDHDFVVKFMQDANQAPGSPAAKWLKGLTNK